MVEVTGEGPGESENVLIFLPSVPQLLNLPLQLQVHRLVGLAQPLVERLSGALVGGDGPVPDQSEAGMGSRDPLSTNHSSPGQQQPGVEVRQLARSLAVRDGGRVVSRHLGWIQGLWRPTSGAAPALGQPRSSQPRWG